MVSANTSELYRVLQNAEGLDKSRYTPVSVEEFEYYYIEALEIFGDSNATQEEINQATRNLSLSIEMLALRADFSNLQSILTEVETDIFNHESRYTDYSFMAVENAYHHGVEVLNNKNSTQEEVDNAYASIEYNIDQLEKNRTGFGTFVSVVLTLGMLGLATFIMSEEGEGGLSVIVWIIGLIALAIILSNNPTWPWWSVCIAELITIAASTFGVLTFL